MRALQTSCKRQEIISLLAESVSLSLRTANDSDQPEAALIWSTAASPREPTVGAQSRLTAPAVETVTVSNYRKANWSCLQ